MSRYQVQVRGQYGGAVGDWRPAITGTLNQTGQSDDDAVTLALESGADSGDVRVVEVA